MIKLTEILDSYNKFKTAKKTKADAEKAEKQAKKSLSSIMVKYFEENEMPSNTLLKLNSEIVTYDVTDKKELPVKVWYDYFKSGKITEEQFLDAINVVKGDVKKHVGELFISENEIVVKGETADLRFSKTNTDIKYDPRLPVQVVTIKEDKSEIKAKDIDKAKEALSNSTNVAPKLLKRKLG
jgi:hypothetical protein